MWLSSMTDGEYQACSRGHRAAGTFQNGTSFGMVNVESIGGHLLVQHYLAQTVEAEFVFMHSQKSRVYLFHVFPVSIEVDWSLAVDPKDRHNARLTCSVETRMRKPLELLAQLGMLPFFLRRHVQEETISFGKDIARKLAVAFPSPLPSLTMA
jgi:hypothetical protein